MGSKNCPETPRQKLIGMMYLVLTALLALNVSKEILEAFVTVNQSMEETNSNFGKKIAGTYASFKNRYTLNKEKVGPYWDKAQKVKELSDNMINYIKNMQYELIGYTDGISIEEAKKRSLEEVKGKDKFNDPTQFFIGGTQDGSKGKGIELKNKIDEYRKALLSYVDPKYKSVFEKNIGLVTDADYHNASGQKQNWQMHNFYHTILAADITILNKIINEVQNAEFDVVSHLMSSVSAEDYTFDRVGAKVVAKSNYVLTGEQYEAEIFVAAYDTKSAISAEIGGARIMGDSGMIKYTVGAGAPGLKTYSGFITVKAPTGDQTYPFESEYIVAPPSMSVAPTKMNVFYIGVDNPVSISVAGVADKDVTPRISAGSITRAKEGWIVTVPNTATEAVITVTAKMGDKVKQMGQTKFRVKRVPDPKPFIANKNDGMIDKNVLSAAGAIIPRMEGFDFDLNFEISSFVFSTVQGGDVVEVPVRGNRLDTKCINIIKNAKRGQKVYFESITAKGPDGTTRRLSNVMFRLQ